MTAPAAGAVALVGVTAATLWTSPEAVRPLDRPALADPVDLSSWVAAMDDAERLGPAVLTQLLLAEPVRVVRVQDGWAEVVALAQPAPRRHQDGYPGWLPSRQLRAGPPATGGRLVVGATTALCARPAGPAVLPEVVPGTSLVAAGAAEAGWCPLWVPGHDAPLWADQAAVGPVPTGATGGELVDVSAAWLGVPYVWGGLSPAGLDCSGLVHLSLRRLGIPIARDAEDQSAATTPVPPGQEGPGDLVFFGRPDGPVHHVGIVLAPPTLDSPLWMRHASGRGGGVVDEPLGGELTATVTGVHRVDALA